ncbi:MAG: S41 family peptidase, partial [Bacteroidota bacterium]
LDGKKDPGYEGIWVSEPYVIAIKREENAYVGSILEADGVYWQKDQVKLTIAPSGKEVAASYFMRDHSEQKMTEVNLVGNNHLEIGFVNLRRTYPELEELPEVVGYNRAMSARAPYFEQLDERTTYLRIPSFSGSEKPLIDSVINANRDRITNTENFIIDIRNNGGGADRSYAVPLSFLYTNPIRTIGVEYYSTELNNQRMLDFIEKPEYGFSEEGKQWARESHEKLSAALGKFVSLNDNPVSITTYDTIYPYPRQVAILINENNGSTSEQFLLAAKQSKKTKLFGVTTTGVLDISNIYFVNSPCNRFQLGYCLTRSMRIPHMAIDGKGIMPDYYLGDSVLKHEWLSFTRKVLAGK